MPYNCSLTSTTPCKLWPNLMYYWLVKCNIIFRFMNYGSGLKKFPLEDVLQYALEFARSRCSPDSTQVTISASSPQRVTNIDDVEMLSPGRAATRSLSHWLSMRCLIFINSKTILCCCFRPDVTIECASHSSPPDVTLTSQFSTSSQFASNASSSPTPSKVSLFSSSLA